MEQNQEISKTGRGLVSATEFNLSAIEELALKLDSEELKEGVTVNSTWHSFNSKGDKLRCVFVGVKSDEFKNDNGELEKKQYVQFMDAEQRLLNNGSTMLVQHLKHLTPGQLISVEYLGVKNKVKQYTVRLLG